MGAALFVPVHDHAGLRERKCEEGAHGIERNESVRNSAKRDQQQGGEDGESHDAVGIDEAASSEAEGVGEIVVLSDGATQAREVREGGVGGKRKHQQDRTDG